MKIETIKVPVTPTVDHILGRTIYTERAVVFDHNHKEKESQHHNQGEREKREHQTDEPANIEQKSTHIDVVA